jgi:hypothetical protein
VAELKTAGYLGYSLEAIVLDYEIFRLVSAMAASREIAGLAYDSPNERAWPWLRKVEFPEVCRLLIGIAAIVRNQLDLDSDFRAEGAGRPVGELVYDDTQSNVEVLTLREACNKILHTAHINPDIDDQEGPHMGSLKPIVHLYGTHRDRPWKATVRIYEFAAAAWGNT